MRRLKRHCVTGIEQGDRISNLPRNVIDQILSRLSITDGARTSVLSKTWRYKWSELPCLVFDNSLSGFEDRLTFTEFATIVDHVVFLHRGTILRFKYSNYERSGDFENRALDRWILHLSKSPIMEFAISTGLDGYCLPPCLFDCQSLTQLSLSCGSIKLPSTFKGFPNLKSLVLRLRKIVEKDLEKLITRCLVLESLALKITNFLSHVNFVAPNLVFLSVEGDIGSLSFENTSRLAYASIMLHGYSDPKFQVCSNSSNLLKFCAQIPMIRKLKISAFFLKYLAVAIDPSNLPSAHANLESLTLYVNLNDRGDCLGACGILNIFQNLCKLSIEVNFYSNRNKDLTLSDGNIWEDQRLSCRFNNLKLVNIKGNGITGTRRDLEFIEFVLSSSPVLERMVIKAYISEHYGDDNDDDDENRMMMVVKKLLSFKRASVHAQVIFEDRYI